MIEFLKSNKSLIMRYLSRSLNEIILQNVIDIIENILNFISKSLSPILEADADDIIS